MEKNVYVYTITARWDVKDYDRFNLNGWEFLHRQNLFTNDRSETNTKMAAYIISEMIEQCNKDGLELRSEYECREETKHWYFDIYQKNYDKPIGWGWVDCYLITGDIGNEMAPLNSIF